MSDPKRVLPRLISLEDEIDRLRALNAELVSEGMEAAAELVSEGMEAVAELADEIAEGYENWSEAEDDANASKAKVARLIARNIRSAIAKAKE